MAINHLIKVRSAILELIGAFPEGNVTRLLSFHHGLLMEPLQIGATLFNPFCPHLGPESGELVWMVRFVDLDRLQVFKLTAIEFGLFVRRCLSALCFLRRAIGGVFLVNEVSDASICPAGFSFAIAG
jgi:hypothetical protein